MLRKKLSWQNCSQCGNKSARLQLICTFNLGLVSTPLRDFTVTLTPTPPTRRDTKKDRSSCIHCDVIVYDVTCIVTFSFSLANVNNLRRRLVFGHLRSCRSWRRNLRDIWCLDGPLLRYRWEEIDCFSISPSGCSFKRD